MDSLPNAFILCFLHKGKPFPQHPGCRTVFTSMLNYLLILIIYNASQKLIMIYLFLYFSNLYSWNTTTNVPILSAVSIAIFLILAPFLQSLFWQLAILVNEFKFNTNYERKKTVCWLPILMAMLILFVFNFFNFFKAKSFF